MKDNVVSTPLGSDVSLLAARTQYHPSEVHPPYIKVKDAIDIHCHAHEGQQDGFDRPAGWVGSPTLGCCT